MKSSKLAEAFDFANRVHGLKTWKNTARPFIHHPLAVAALVQFYGGDDSQVQAALLHDTITEGITCEEINKLFSVEVAELVRAFEDPPEVDAQKMDWANGKKAYLKKIENLPPKAVFVIACEELHELSVLNHDAKYGGAEVWSRYPVPGRDLGWYYKALTSTLYRTLTDKKYFALISEFANQTKTISNRVFEGISP